MLKIKTMDILSFLRSTSRQKEMIVDRLLSEGSIDSKEAVILLKTFDKISVGRIELSSGAKIVAGDDNETTTH